MIKGDYRISKDPLRILKQIAIPMGPNACWRWKGANQGPERGYGQVSWMGESMGAHRAAYLILVGPISEGKHLDHLCRNRLCCNPQHLEQVSKRENTLRGEGPAAVHAKKTHCKNGHLLAGDNLRNLPKVFKAGSTRRQCKKCLAAYNRKYHAKKSLAKRQVVTPPPPAVA